MIFQVITENGVKKIQELTADTGAGAPVGSLISMYKKSNPSGYLYCDGSTFDETAYPALYQYLGSNVLPDYREFALVGAEENTTDVYNASTNPNGTIHDHDVYTEGQAKDDQVQTHYHNVPMESAASFASGPYNAVFMRSTTNTSNNTGRSGTTTHGKQKAVFFYIKATSGLSENQQENVLNTINENLSYSTEEHATGKKWIDGKDIYSISLTTTELISTDSFYWGGLQSDIQNLNVDTMINVFGVDNMNNRKSFRPIAFTNTDGLYPWGTGLAIGSVLTFEYTKTN